MTAATPARRTRSVPGARLERLWETTQTPGRGSVRGGSFPARLRNRYDGELRIALRGDRPTIIANFVSTLDGVVAFDADESSGGGEVSGFFEPDRFVMGLLRAMADVVLVGAGTVRAAPTHEWTARRVQPKSEQVFDQWRRRLGLASAQPTTVVVTASGSVDPRHPGLSAPDVPVILVTTKAGAERLRAAGPGPNARIEIAGHDDRISMAQLMRVLRATRAHIVLCEGGPHLIGDLVEEHLLDELFLTVAPQLAGRDRATPRLGLVEGAAFEVDGAPWARLVSVRRSGDHLFLRHAFSGRRRRS